LSQPGVPLSLPERREIEMLHKLEEICDWLGTYRQRLRLARSDKSSEVGAVVTQLEARLQARRAELP